MRPVDAILIVSRSPPLFISPIQQHLAALGCTIPMGEVIVWPLLTTSTYVWAKVTGRS